MLVEIIETGGSTFSELTIPCYVGRFISNIDFELVFIKKLKRFLKIFRLNIFKKNFVLKIIYQSILVDSYQRLQTTEQHHLSCSLYIQFHMVMVDNHDYI